MVVLSSGNNSCCPEREAQAIENDTRPRSWYAGQLDRHLEIHPQIWRWPKKLAGGPVNSTSLLEFKTVHIYKLLLAHNHSKKWQPLALQWHFPIALQKAILKLIWQSQGILPKVKAMFWRMYQAALPNADRFDVHLVQLNKQFCSLCPGQLPQKSNHIFFDCVFSQVIWKKLEWWLRQRFPMVALRLTSRVVFTGMKQSSNVPLFKEQWWPIVWSSTLFKLWVGWTSQIYGSEQVEEFNA